MIPDYMLPFANHLWQSTLFVVAVWLMTLVFRKNRAAVRHRLWLAASVKFLVPFSLLASFGSLFQWQTALVTTPPPVSMIVETISQPFSVSASSVAPQGTTPAPQASRFPVILIGIWISGVTASLFWWFIRWRQVRRAVRLATPSNFDGPLRVMYGRERFEPGVFGIFMPVLLLPDGISDRLSPEQLDAVLAHELCHVRRRDNLTAAIHMIVEALFWFHPLVWWIKVRLIEEQERACDEEVLRLGGNPQIYAESILKICEFYLTSPLICVAGITGSNLKSRIEEIMRNRVAYRLSLGRMLLLAAAVIVAVAGPIAFGVVPATAGQAQSARGNPSEPAYTLVPRPIASAEQRPIASAEQRPIAGAEQRLAAVQTSQLPAPPGAKRPTFEVTSVRPSASPFPLPPSPSPGGRFSAESQSLKALVTYAYGLRNYQVLGLPAWADKDLWQIQAKAAEGGIPLQPANPAPKLDPIKLMLQSLLEERFQLKAHFETQGLPIYEVVIAKGGQKLKLAADQNPVIQQNGLAPASASFGPDGLPQLKPGSLMISGRNPIMLEAKGMPLLALINTLISVTGLPVIDKTGLQGLYDIKLEWTPDNLIATAPVGNAGGAPQTTLPPGVPLATAIEEQLGLRLESTKGPVDVLVIDHAEKPSEN